MRHPWVLLCLVGTLCGISCGLGDKDLASVAPDSIPQTVTWSEHIRPIMQYYCVKCHMGSARQDQDPCRYPHLNFKAYETTAECAANIDQRVLKDKNMPPPLSQLPTARHKALLQKWFEGGMTE